MGKDFNLVNRLNAKELGERGLDLGKVSNVVSINPATLYHFRNWQASE